MAKLLFTDPPFRFAHGASLIETDDGFLIAWFAGRHEGHAETAIWLTRGDGDVWAPPVRVTDGGEEPCWNPVLHALPSGQILLFHRVGPHPRRWRSRLLRSDDAGATWSEPEDLPEDCLGPIRNHALARPDGTLLCPSSTEHAGWRCHLERFDPATNLWRRGPDLPDPDGFEAIQPALLDWGDDRLQALCRSARSRVVESWSEDGGETWSPLAPTALPNPNSAVDAARPPNGPAAIAYNPSALDRWTLQLALSDDGRRWRPGPALDQGPGEKSYPSLIAARDGRLAAVWTADRAAIAFARVERPAD